MLFLSTLTVLASLSTLVSALSISTLKQRPFFEKAVVVLNGEKTNGTVFFTQSNPDGPVQITGLINGLSANAKHGFHVHQYGNLTAGCTSAGGHFNPYNQTHGAPTSLVRHVGDLGNLETDANGVANFTFTDNVISLNGITSIIGRGVVVHAGTDDLGLGGNADSLTTGNAGARAACGVVGLA